MTTSASCAVAFFAIVASLANRIASLTFESGGGTPPRQPARCRRYSSLELVCGRYRSWGGAFVIALFVRARDHRPVLAKAFDQVVVAAAGTFLRDRLRCRSKLALRITSAAIEGIALP